MVDTGGIPSAAEASVAESGVGGRCVLADGADEDLVDVDGGGLGDGVEERAGDVAGF
jgi:hypothetical protein